MWQKIERGYVYLPVVALVLVQALCFLEADSHGDHAESEDLMPASNHIESQTTPTQGLALIVIFDVYSFLW